MWGCGGLALEPLGRKLCCIWIIALTVHVEVNASDQRDRQQQEQLPSSCKEKERLAWQDPKSQGHACSIYIIDANELAPEIGIPTCDLSNFASDLLASMVWPNPRKYGIGPMGPGEHPHKSISYPYAVTDHSHAQTAAPWHFYQSLKKSRHRVKNIDDADAVFVYDYCYIIWVIAESNGQGHGQLQEAGYKPNPDVLKYQIKLYRHIINMPRWKRDGGRSFVFWLPFGGLHTGPLWKDTQVGMVEDMLCMEMQPALFLVSVLFLRWKCERFNPERVLVVPLSSMDKGSMSVPMDRPRPIFLLFKNTCQPEVFVGKRFRARFAEALWRANAPDVVAECTEGIWGHPKYNNIVHSQMMGLIYESKFCPIIPGDDQASQSLTERYIAGCIPVFIGPPYHAIPFEKEVDYPSSAIFINITGSDLWMNGSVMEWSIPDIPEEGKLVWWKMVDNRMAWHWRWWMPLGIPDSALVQLETLDDVLPYLRGLHPSTVEDYQAGVLKERSKFIYHWRVHRKPAANRIILDNICHFVGKACSQRRAYGD